MAGCTWADGREGRWEEAESDNRNRRERARNGAEKWLESGLRIGLRRLERSACLARSRGKKCTKNSELIEVEVVRSLLELGMRPL